MNRTLELLVLVTVYQIIVRPTDCKCLNHSFVFALNNSTAYNERLAFEPHSKIMSVETDEIWAHGVTINSEIHVILYRASIFKPQTIIQLCNYRMCGCPTKNV